MFSPDSFYDYLRYYFNINKKNISVRTFNNPGDNILFNSTSTTSNRLTPYLLSLSDINHKEIIMDSIIHRYNGYCEMYDQDPISIISLNHSSIANIELFPKNANLCPNTIKHLQTNRKNVIKQINNPVDLMSHHSAGIYNPMVCHSEKHSNDVNILNDKNFIPVHYWYHAYIGLYWFQQYKYLYPSAVPTTNRFGVYVRDASGTRTYRIDLINKLTQINNKVHFTMNEPFISQVKKQNKSMILSKWNTNKTSISSESSAFIDWPDVNMFDIQIIPETLFDTEKTHLTEKSLKPIVMGQPFIIVGCPHSLKYLHDYGFKTFSSLWDESYDTEVSSTIRFEKIINLIYNIANLSPSEYQKMFNEAKKIALYNRKHFYSEKFEQHLINELHNELNNAFEIRNEMYYKMPGGTYFYIMNKFHKKGILTEISYQNIKNMMEYINTHHLDIAKQIIKKYNHLL